MAAETEIEAVVGIRKVKRAKEVEKREDVVGAAVVVEV